MPDKEQVKKEPVVRTVTPTEYVTSFQANAGEYHMVALDKDGNEIAGSDFSVSERTYSKSYKDENKFKVKKSPNA